jgi:HK97 family phage major capsid protein
MSSKSSIEQAKRLLANDGRQRSKPVDHDVAALNGSRVRPTSPQERQATVDYFNAFKAGRAGAAMTAVVREKVELGIDGHLDRAFDLVDRAAGRRMSDSDWRAFRGHTRAMQELRDRARELREMEQEWPARVVSEPSPYQEGSPHSWIMDVQSASERHADPLHDDGGALKRLDQHARDIGDEVWRGTSAGKLAQRMVGEHCRTGDEDRHRERVQAETRSFQSGGGATASAAGGGFAAFVPPVLILSDWAQYRESFAAVAAAATTRPLPTWGLNVYVPRLTTPPTVGTQTEGDAITETNPVVAFDSTEVEPIISGVAVSQQLLDRAGPGIEMDRVLLAQVREQAAAQVDSYLIGVLLSGAQSVPDATTGGFVLGSTSGVAAGFLNDLRAAKQLISSTAGVKTKATHVFAPSIVTDYLEAFVDASGRPVFSPCAHPQIGGGLSASGDVAAEGWTGYVVSGLQVWADDNIPAASSEQQMIVSRAADTLLYAGEPVVSVLPQFGASSLVPQVTVRQYVAAVAKWPSAVAVISGAMYATSNFA